MAVGARWSSGDLKIGTDWSMPKEYVRFPSREELEADCRALLATAVQREAVAVG